MWKKTWILGFLLAAGALQGCSCGSDGGTNPGGIDAGSGGGISDGGGSGSDGGSADSGTTGPTLGKLSLEPINPILTVTGTTARTQGFVLKGTFSDGHTEDLTGKATFSIEDTRLGLFGGGSLFTTSTTVGGASTVHARVGTMSVSTGLTVLLDQSVSDSPPTGSSTTTPVPTTPGSKFNGAVDLARKPRIVYPNNGVLVPPNLGQLEVHFLPGSASNTLFELRFSNTITDVKVYLRCYRPSGVTLSDSTGCIYTPEDKVWKFIAESNRGGKDVRLVLRGTDDSGTASVGVSDPIAIQFARAELKGALYYWTTKSDRVGVIRYDFAGTGPQVAESILKASNINTGVSCIGCHALSRNGKKLVAEVNGQYDGRFAMVDLSTWKATDKTGLSSTAKWEYRSTFESWNSDGTKFAGVYGDTDDPANPFGVRIFNGSTGAFEGEIPGTGDVTSRATHPDWSPDGKTIAYMSPGQSGSNQRSFQGAIKAVTQDGSGGWNVPITVVPRHDATTTGNVGKNRYYPAIAPDNAFLVYNESTCPGAGRNADTVCNGDTDQTASLWAALIQPYAARVELKRANQGGIMDAGATSLTNSYPKWSPFVTRGSNGDTSRLMWLTFSTSRKYGLRNPPAGGDENPQGTLLWMAAVDPDKVTAGVDPSSPAFALPFQDITTSNHIAQWAQYLVSNGCSTEGESCGTCCNGLQCVQTNRDPPLPCDVAGACVCQAIPQCAPSFAKCSSAAPCCDGLTCLDDTSGAACKDGNCSCRPPCSGVGQTCGEISPCCEGLSCSTSGGASTCQTIIR